ncbi:FecR family protein [Pedobacter sp. L105]|uniref:FecR family protein n=1 Tax=Pedobacter sp. L105 TaxID=1641871 RepID=UPI00131CC4A1|nr:FecR family protein [Pedobacter sp. L105]
MEKDQIKLVFQKFNDGIATEDEVALLESWYLKYNEEPANRLTPEYIEQDIMEVYHLLPKPAKTISLWPRIVAAASVVLVLSLGFYVFHHQQADKELFAQNKLHDLAPGGNKAVLTLANGKQIVLTNVSNGNIATQGGTIISKTADGELVYHSSKEKNGLPEESALNTITTPRGGQYHLILSDGTQVWLNAASSIKYPAVFRGTERRVEITGEAYFEVVYNKNQPFKVLSGSQTTEDLGTHFNINAYDDEQTVKTTLVEGSVKVLNGANNTILKPGQQSSVGTHGINVLTVNTQEAIAWKNGFFLFKNADLQTIMRQLSRWYDVDISYEGKIPEHLFTGDMHRNLKASELLELLSFYKVHFKIEGRKIIVNE